MYRYINTLFSVAIIYFSLFPFPFLVCFLYICVLHLFYYTRNTSFALPTLFFCIWLGITTTATGTATTTHRVPRSATAAPPLPSATTRATARCSASAPSPRTPQSAPPLVSMCMYVCMYTENGKYAVAVFTAPPPSALNNIVRCCCVYTYRIFPPQKVFFLSHFLLYCYPPSLPPPLLPPAASAALPQWPRESNPLLRDAPFPRTGGCEVPAGGGIRLEAVQAGPEEGAGLLHREPVGPQVSQVKSCQVKFGAVPLVSLFCGVLPILCKSHPVKRLPSWFILVVANYFSGFCTYGVVYLRWWWCCCI
jgi:hypothetical protein